MSQTLGPAAPSAARPLALLRRTWATVPPTPSTVDLTGATVLVTGANSGLGFESCRQFLALPRPPARLLMGVRSQTRGDAAAARLRSEFPGAVIDVWLVDHASYASVRAFAARVSEEVGKGKLRVAVLNAGGAHVFYERSKETGHEATLQENYLATALLALLLLPALRASSSTEPPGRLTIVTADAALNAKLPPLGTDSGDKLFDVLDQDPGKKYHLLTSYGQTKLLLAMFVAQLAERVPADRGVIINAVNPGGVRGTAGYDEWKRHMSWPGGS
jgi:NAD(P)-dependent dehydrogenase (short-subunit alcohol dehydrogenase family)